MKLKQLILSGFKSFADKTTFDFDEGISCVVGPNGCGKSNIVDAIKWVLGEQSAKSLRGGEMLDVIFNGSSARRAAGMAEVTLVFDNTSGALDAAATGDGDSGDNLVSIGRQLFRSGQSEYLINGSPCRLKDIRELFMGTGVGHDAYALIEQGRVEVFLQGSHDDRRAIFDEAAGISKYKARKKEALRKLDRVEQNLLRLDDIVGEVEKRLRSIKYQAGKARNYQEYSERLKQLRGLHFLAQYHTQTENRTALQRKLDGQSGALALIARRIEQLEAAGSGAEFEASEMERSVVDLQSRAATLSAQRAACGDRQRMLTEKLQELRDQIAGDCHRCEQLEAKESECTAQQQQRRTDVETVETNLVDLTAKAQEAAEQFQEGELAVTHLSAELEDEKTGTIDLLRRTAQLHNDLSASTVRRENLHNQKTALTDRARKLTDELTGLLSARSEAQARLRDVREVLSETQTRLDDTRRAGQELSGSESQLQTELGDAREKRSAISARIDALREMLSRLEGVGAGVRQVLEAHRTGQLPAVRGMLGQFIQTDVKHARVIEAALSGWQQHLVVDRFDQLQSDRKTVAGLLAGGGSVEFVCLDRLGPWQSDVPSPCDGMVARAIDWVQFDAFLAPVMWRLLGQTLVVKTLDDATTAARTMGGQWRFVTEAGEVLEPDGRVRVGSPKSAGVISRRSELAELETSLTELTARIDELQIQWQQAHEQRQHMDDVVGQLRTAIYEANTERVEAEGRATQLDQQVAELQRNQPVIASDIANLAGEIDQAVATEHDARKQAEQLEQLSTERNAHIESLQQRIDQARKDQEDRSATMTELRVRQAEVQQQKLSLTETLTALVRQGQQLAQDLSSARGQIELARQRVTDTEQAITDAGTESEQLTAQQQSVATEIEQVEQSRKSLQQRIAEIRSQLTQQRKAHDEGGQAVGEIRVEIGQADAHLEDLITRAADEMGMDLRTLRDGYEHDEQRDWAAVETEINDLKGKIERLGNVNLDAIEEQSELEQRREFLDTQLSDVRSSHKQLEELIDRLNTESHDRFVETFEAVRANFQDLFRKLFGGGKADIVLTMPEDVLESGIDIVARPPGKELRSITLLSGGEKTMTALALMMSMFKHRPTPFCLLDEVDAALDEANTERFSHLVQEFIEHSQFIIISHAKRTMSMANVLYGVTMQTPGVSTRISVKFEDVGHTLDEQLQPVSAT